jgi:MFS transporter, DHA2 family, multidrug resistance protein
LPATTKDHPHAIPHINPWIVAIAVMLGTFMEVLDTTVVNVSLPHIAGSLSATIDEATWAITSYLVANAMILPITGWLANYFGRKRLLMMSVTGFTMASFLCGLAPTLPLLILFRVIQGAAGGALQPLSQAVLLESFPPEQRGKAMGFWGQGIVVAPIIGPVLGGWLTDTYSWRWVFYINIPVGIASIVMTSLFIFDPPYIKRASQRIDYWGMGMLAVGIGSLQVMLDKGQEQDWFASHWITGLLVAAGRVSGRVYRPRIAYGASRGFAAGVQRPDVQHRRVPDDAAGIRAVRQPGAAADLAADGAGISRGSGGDRDGAARHRLVHRDDVIGRIMHKFDPRKFLAIGLLVGAGTLFQLSRLNLEAGYWDFFWPQFVQGMSLAMLFVPLTTITMSNIRAKTWATRPACSICCEIWAAESALRA